MHAFVYEPTTGELTQMRVDFTSYLKELRNVYDLYNYEDGSYENKDAEKSDMGFLRRIFQRK